MLLQLPANALNSLGESTASIGGEAVSSLASNPSVLVLGIILIAAAVVIFYVLKKLVVNSILGFIGWILLVVLVGVEGTLLIPTLAVSLIFGLAGVGVLLMLMFFAVI
ncbi:MAG: hypothetical protein CL943_02795 [Candidatus Diapherotrites archaeon]|uniref:Uncharacterized protein n=1 Tax=Candidatus Iainarchaeum sp. TaxID=3101447 RepID=A0A2D6M1B3_9ARCH|nr:hypothetical protein [Candidatus Diapherotrites archaeon]|tara:strand:+ start:3230 stop:3553 length:324 start_codon:yes stop_codon:yes gene_type:complete